MARKSVYVRRTHANLLKMAVLGLGICVASTGICSSTLIPARLNDGLSVGSPEDADFDKDRLAQGFDKASKLPYSHSLLVLRDGKLVAEQYFHGFTQQSANNLKSVSKSIVSTLVGIALDRKTLKSVEMPVHDFFPKFFSEMNDSKKNEILLKHLLSMSAGLDANDDNAKFRPWPELDVARFTLMRPLLTAPGQAFSYSSTYTEIVSRVLAEASGKSVRAFAEKYLFGPMGIRVLGWPTDALGYHQAEIFLTSRDTAKFGLLFLNKGRYGNKRIVSEKWVNESTTPKIKASEGNGLYGYYWWIKPDEKIPFYYAWGYGGQYIYVVPTKRLVVVMTNDFTQRRAQTDIRAILEQDIIAAAKN